MARKHDFKPDRQRSDILGKLLLTKKQRREVLRWTLYSLVCLAGLLVQDAAAYRIRLMGACADLVPCLIMMIVVMQGAESGCIFALVASCLSYFSGSAVGAYVIPLITAAAILVGIFRQGRVSRGIGAILLCTAIGMLLYEYSLFGIGLFFGLTTAQRAGAMAVTVLLSLVAVPIVYPVLLAIGKIGGETWKE